MPCVWLDTCYLKEVLAALRLPRCSWLITDLECLDYCGWEGCEKWAEQELLLTDDALRRDVPDVTAEEANEVQWRVWHRLFREHDDAVEETRLCAVVREVYAAQRLDGKRHYGAYWDPYGQG